MSQLLPDSLFLAFFSADKNETGLYDHACEFCQLCGLVSA